jgi:predicted alpha/beta superfamily hydrolase
VNDPQTVLAALETAPSILLPLIQEIPEPLRKRRPSPAKWSAHEHFCHLAVVEALFHHRLDLILGEHEPLIAPYQPSPEDEAGALLEVDLGEAMERFTRDRAVLVARLRDLPPEGWERRGRHPEMPNFTVFTMARHAALHTMLHGYRIEEVLFKQDRPAAEVEAPRETPAPAEVVAAEPARPAGPSTVQEGIPGVLSRLRAGAVNVLGPFAVPELPARYVRVYLPRDYMPEREGGNFGLWMFDGQNVFDDAGSFSGGWYVHEAAERLARAGRPVPVIVGIDHGNEARVRELSPFDWEGEPGQITLLLDWITGTLMPLLCPELHLLEGPIGAVVGGSSMGGLAALWSHFHYPHAFGGALAMSPSLWLADQAIFADLEAQPDPPLSRIYLDMGAREDRGRMLPIAAAMAAHLAGRGWEDDRLLWRPDAKGGHNETSWRRRLPKALRFLYR